MKIHEFKRIRKSGDLSYLPPDVRAEVAEYCVCLSIRMLERINRKSRGILFFRKICLRKSWNKYMGMYRYYRGCTDEALMEQIEKISEGARDEY